VDSTKTVTIYNDNAPNFVSAPKKYAQAKEIQRNKNIINTKTGKKYTFVTKYLLPNTWKNGGKNGKTEYWFNCQSMVVSGKYIYVYTSAGYGSKKGFIIRYDTKILDKYGNKNGLSSLRKLGNSLRNGKSLTLEEKKILKGIKIGKVFIGGHGQSLTYDPKTKSLWMWQDDSYSSTKLKLMKINMKTLKPKIIYEFKAKLDNSYLKQFLNLAFDSAGNFYTERNIKTNNNPSGYLCLFRGKIVNGKIQMKLLCKIKNRPGTNPQALAINHVNNRVYFVSDGVIYSAPLNKIISGTITMHDFYYTVFSTNREFEGLSFDKYGRAYLLLIRGTEILRAEQVH
jgi:hypothetical protein